VNALIYDRDAVLGISAPIEHQGQAENPPQLLEIRRHAAYKKSKEVRNNPTDDLGII